MLCPDVYQISRQPISFLEHFKNIELNALTAASVIKLKGSVSIAHRVSYTSPLVSEVY